jgi:uncharacterized protein (DUF2147 family)
MFKLIKAVRLAATAACVLYPATTLAQQRVQDIVLRNPSNSVHLRIHPCGKGRCGTVVWANDKAKKDSARGGTPNLVGTELFREFREVSPKVWKGKVFVPDMNKVFTGTATVRSADLVVARGCLFGSIGCKSQNWTRVR